MPKGNPNPSPATRFTSSGNPAGKTSEQKRLEYEAAEMAARIRHKMLIRMQEKIDQPVKNDKGEEEAFDPLAFLSADALRLLKDSEDRAHGTPRQSVEHTGANGGPLHIVERRIVRKGDNG